MAFTRLKKYRQLYDPVMKGMIETVKAEWSPGSTSCFIEMYAEHILQSDKEDPGKHTFNGDNLFHAVTDLFPAGTETTATTLKWALLHMMMFDDI